MPYNVEVVEVEGLNVVLHVVPEQPDCEPFYDRADFVAAMLAEAGPGSLSELIHVEELYDGVDFDASAFIDDYTLEVVRPWNLATNEAPMAEYRVTMTDRKWLEHVQSGSRWESYAWCEEGPYIDGNGTKAELPLRTIPNFAVWDRVHLRHLDFGWDARRGSIVRIHDLTQRPGLWHGGTTVAHVALDHGPKVWVQVEALELAPDDLYERAFIDVPAFVSRLMGETPLKRAEQLWELALITGGDGIVEATSVGRTFQVVVPHRSARWYALLRRLGWPRSLNVAVELVGDWVGDDANHDRRIGRELVGRDYTRGEAAHAHHPVYFTPLPLTLGAIVLLVAEQSYLDDPGSAAAMMDRDVRQRCGVLATTLPTLHVGTPASAMFGRFLEFLTALADGECPTLPRRLVVLEPTGRENAELGEVVLRASEADLYA